jgi:hypothetical protein
MMSKQEFYTKWHDYFKKFTSHKRFLKHGPHYEDDDYMDKMLLIVLDDMPVQVRAQSTHKATLYAQR